MTASEPLEIPDWVQELEEYTESINMMVYSDPGVGKTVLGGSYGKRSLIIATENGTVAAARQGSQAAVADCRGDWMKFEEITEWLQDNADRDGFPYDWVIIDTGTALQDIILQDIVQTAVDVDTEGKRSRDKYELQEWGEGHNRFRRYVGYYNDLPVHTLWLAHAMNWDDEEGNTIRMPKFQGKHEQMSVWMSAQMHCYGYMHMVPVKLKDDRIVQRRQIEWQANSKWRAKDRFDVLGKPKGYTRSLDLKQLTDIILADAAVEETPAPAKKAPAKKAAPAAATKKEGSE